MLRIPAIERPDLERVAKEHSFQFQADAGIPFWDESFYYSELLSGILDHTGAFMSFLTLSFFEDSGKWIINLVCFTCFYNHGHSRFLFRS